MFRPSTLLFSAIFLVSCGGIKDPNAVKDRTLSTLSDDDIRGICAFNTKKYREAIPTENWDSVRCANLTLLDIKAYNELMSAHGQKVSREDCASRLTSCIGAPTYEIWTPERDCERVDTQSEQQCKATVAELQACLDERIERAKLVIPKIQEKNLCDASNPFAEINTMSGPACSRFKASCPDSNLALPGFIRAVK